jgi:hypothetical protein
MIHTQVFTDGAVVQCDFFILFSQVVTQLAFLLHNHFTLYLVMLLLSIPNDHICKLFFHPHVVVFLMLASCVQRGVFQKLATMLISELGSISYNNQLHPARTCRS